MAWVKIDDQFFMHPKVIAAGRDARDFYLAALTYSAGQLTDGYVPAGALALIAAMAGVLDADAQAARLMQVRLWEPTDGGYRIHDYHDYNPSADHVRAVRAARAEAGRQGGLASAASRAEPDAQANAEANEQANAEANASANGKPTATPSPSPSPSPDPGPELGTTPQTAPAPAPATEPEAKKGRSRKDPRTDHVAIQAIRSVTGRLPPKPTYDRIIREVGGRPDVKKMRECFEVWVSRHNDPLNLDGWLFDWYFRGIRPQIGASARGSPTTAPAPQADEERRRTAIEANRRRREEVQRARQQS